MGHKAEEMKFLPRHFEHLENAHHISLNYKELHKMYSRHANTALRRGQSIPNDIARVTEGIAASLRQFSLSASRYADEQSQ